MLMTSAVRSRNEEETTSFGEGLIVRSVKIRRWNWWISVMKKIVLQGLAVAEMVRMVVMTENKRTVVGDAIDGGGLLVGVWGRVNLVPTQILGFFVNVKMVEGAPFTIQ
ncbi:hypothetical protein HanIR_Chr15g0763191 [Helianthus annuus]|nr:hypothetical protein HanIR_Chr15g0763191 [Helianthus annuus]